MLVREELRKYAKKSSFENFESALYSTSVSMPLTCRQKKNKSALTKMARTFSHIRACISHVHLHRHIVCANSACGHTRTHNVSANDACNSVLLEHYTHSHAYSHAYRIACGACICMRCTQYSARITACTRCIAHALILTPCK